jgi:uncharacterized membrane protein
MDNYPTRPNSPMRQGGASAPEGPNVLTIVGGLFLAVMAFFVLMGNFTYLFLTVLAWMVVAWIITVVGSFLEKK